MHDDISSDGKMQMKPLDTQCAPKFSALSPFLEGYQKIHPTRMRNDQWEGGRKREREMERDAQGTSSKGLKNSQDEVQKDERRAE